LAWPLGARVTIRRHLPAGGYADWVGVLEQATPETVTVRHRSGEARRFEVGEVAIAHLIRERPTRD
jgi:ribosome maturation factor RimP